MLLDIFALVILLILVVVSVGIVAALGIAPGMIAKSRNHPQADAISVCGWMGVLTMGLLLPLAFIWAYYRPASDEEAGS